MVNQCRADSPTLSVNHHLAILSQPLIEGAKMRDMKSLLNSMKVEKKRQVEKIHQKLPIIHDEDISYVPKQKVTSTYFDLFPTTSEPSRNGLLHKPLNETSGLNSLVDIFEETNPEQVLIDTFQCWLVKLESFITIDDRTQYDLLCNELQTNL